MEDRERRGTNKHIYIFITDDGRTWLSSTDNSDLRRSATILGFKKPTCCLRWDYLQRTMYSSTLHHVTPHADADTSVSPRDGGKQTESLRGAILARYEHSN